MPILLLTVHEPDKLNEMPLPGSKQAMIDGCTCPTEQPHLPHKIFLDNECPCHVFERIMKH